MNTKTKDDDAIEGEVEHLPVIQKDDYPIQELPANPQMAAMQIIAEAARNPAVDTEKMKDLIAMRKDMDQYEAEKEFWRAFPKMQNELPTIPKNGVMKQTKNGNSWTIPFAKFEDVIEYCKPVLKKHGFALTFKHKQMENGILRTIGMLSHKGGHVERDEFDAQHDTSGSKNSIQAVGSTRAYGKRYTTGSLLGLAFGGEDDDGAATGDKKDPKPQYITITKDQELTLYATVNDFYQGLEDPKASKKSSDWMNMLCQSMNIKHLNDMPADRFKDAMKSVNERIKKVSEKEETK
ncbi:MAG: ERF family protein [Gammaproteobacteria bacterium]